VPKPLFAKQVISAVNVSKKNLQDLNPGLTYRVWRNESAIPMGYMLRVPFKASGWDQELAIMNDLKGVTSGRGDSGRRHKVTRGQTACGIAERYKVRCRDLISLNKLGKKAMIKIGQNLKIPGGVQKYQTTKIAKASQELRKQLTNVNSLALQNVSSQKKEQLSVNSASDVETNNTAEALQGEKAKPTSIASNGDSNSAKPAEQPSESANGNSQFESSQSAELSKVINLDTSIKQQSGKIWVIALPSESIGLYSDWLGIGGTQLIRQINNFKPRAEIDIYQRVFLPSLSDNRKQQFITSRNEYHLAIQLQYFQRFKVNSLVKRLMRSNETLWSIAKNNRIPMWLVMQYNENARVGKIVQIPIVTAR